MKYLTTIAQKTALTILAVGIMVSVSQVSAQGANVEKDPSLKPISSSTEEATISVTPEVTESETQTETENELAASEDTQTPEESDKPLKDIQNAKKEKVPQDIWKQYIQKTSEDNSKSPQAIVDSELILNGDFSAGSANWTEFFHDGSSWKFIEGSIVGTGDDAEKAYITPGVNMSYDLFSNLFTVPQGVTDMMLQYDYTFNYSTDATACNTGDGKNGVYIYLNNFLTGDYELITYHDITEETGFTTTKTNTVDILAATGLTAKDLTGGQYFIDFFGDTDVTNPACEINFHLDNVSVNASYDDEAPIYVYRFWSDEKQGHFYTGSAEEKNYVITAYADNVWRYEGIAYKAYNYQATGTTPVYRFWSDAKQGHFYTISEEEKDHVIETYDETVWRYEGVAYYVYPLDYSGEAQTVFRFWSDEKQKHFYTASAIEKDYVVETYDETVWKYEGEAWKVISN